MGKAASSSSSLSARGLHVAVVAARYNPQIVDALLTAARSRWRAYGGVPAQLWVERVPGAFELPLAAQRLALTRRIDAVVALGCVIRGDTAHFDYVAGECARGLQRVMLETGVPVSFGVLTVDTVTQARARSGRNALNKGAEALETALAMVQVLRRIASGVNRP
jgi:6,7-dimethyl-8-ribityllumazine synthase